ncbi:MAG: RagB/SusD family nutrient uptake outer membrane protein [Ruminococcus flavefaciens]|nr:RagB/SusD family nutrient uptake outer membrane protein [Ruminococcus flavefaciens]
MLGSTSCNDELNVRSTTQFIPEDIWNEESAAEGYVIASYQTFSDHSNNYLIDSNKFYDAFSDIAKSTSWDQYEHQYNKTWMLSNSFGKNNAGPFNCWGATYGRVKRANKLLNDIDEYAVTRYGEEWCNIRRAEVRFCRAMSYFFAARVYGGLVIRTDKSGVNGTLDDGRYEQDVNRARLSEEETYDWIINELQWAIEHLPNSWETKYVGRATKGMVSGFLSRVALYANRWEVAAQAAEDCKKFGGYSLRQPSAQTFEARVENFKQLFNCRYDAANRVEVIYAIYGKKEIKMNNYDTQMRPFGDSRNPNMGTVNARIVPTVELVDMYEMKDGSTFNFNDPLWSFFYKDPYTDREPRFQATILYNGAEWEGRTIETYKGSGSVADGKDCYSPWTNNASTQGRTCTGYYFRKYLMEGEEITTSNRSYNTEIILRYAEVLLNKAEAYAHLGMFTEACKALNEVRARVGLPARNTTDLNQFMTYLRKERCCELAGEGLRFWDLRRWDLAQQTINEQPVHGHLVTKTTAGIFTYSTVDADGGIARMYQERYRYFSLPSDELNNNKLCKDNPGW